MNGLINPIKRSLVVFNIILLVALFTPYYTISSGGYYPTLLIFLLGGFVGVVLTISSIIFTFKYKIKLSIVFCFIGTMVIMINLIGPIQIVGDNQLGLGFYLGLISSIGLLITNILQFKLIPVEMDLKKKAHQDLVSLAEMDFDKKIRLSGMIKSENKIDLNEAQNIIGIPKNKMKSMIHDFMKEGDLKGVFDMDTFIITSNIEVFIQMLDRSFEEWEKTPKRKAGKN